MVKLLVSVNGEEYWVEDDFSELEGQKFKILDHRGFGYMGDCLESFTHDEILTVAYLIEDGYDDRLLYAVIRHYGSVSEAVDALDCRYVGMYENVGDYAYDCNEHIFSTLPDFLQPYMFSVAVQMEEDWELSGDIDVIEVDWNSRHIFSCH